jgi:hypothetical protein
MSIIRSEEYHYHIIYYNDGDTFIVYKRVNANNWQILASDGKWKSVTYKESEKLENEFKTRNK